jgi:dUTP pyrophosphatase
MSLYIYTGNQAVRDLVQSQLQKHRYTDSGFDIPSVARQIVCPSSEQVCVYTFNLGIRVAAVDSDHNAVPCLLLPRSSISKTAFRLTNSIGLIDAGYRGDVQAKVDVLTTDSIFVEEGTRYFQIVQHNFLPWKNVFLVDDETQLPDAPDDRGTGGFGSTGN